MGEGAESTGRWFDRSDVLLVFITCIIFGVVLLVISASFIILAFSKGSWNIMELVILMAILLSGATLVLAGFYGRRHILIGHPEAAIDLEGTPQEWKRFAIAIIFFFALNGSIIWLGLLRNSEWAGFGFSILVTFVLWSYVLKGL